ncbi:hypothetical protein BDV23DRAFT_73250 [Aspergillus alliaceus]|uniref:Uncharacterized protein n=1 Tax=Petromyces alliaceus TaxID=209559 RepID=A0A5N7CAD4_PETAA|nr:hypothetical protein BDV23DRAFT_73250 [Aspergillus alliaceus]
MRTPTFSRTQQTRHLPFGNIIVETSINRDVQDEAILASGGERSSASMAAESFVCRKSSLEVE